MTFEEEFPSLKKYLVIQGNRGKELKAIKASKEKHFNDYAGISKESLIIAKGIEVSLIDECLKDIQKYCIDKQRIRKSIEKVFSRGKSNMPMNYHVDLLKEFGFT